MAKKPGAQLRLRPRPPADIIETLFEARFKPAHDLTDWVVENIVADTGSLHNEDHKHLIEAGTFGFLWASQGYVKAGRRVLGQTEDLALASRGNAWQRQRHEQQIREWFGDLPPRFLITVDALFCAEASDAEFCALVEHELYHCGHEHDEFGSPKYGKDGRPKLSIRGHDLEEFVGIVDRYGIGDPGGPLARMVLAAARGPTVSPVNISKCCGTCLLRAA